MKKKILSIALLIIQACLIYKGVGKLGSVLNTFSLFIISLAIPVYYLSNLLTQSIQAEVAVNKKFSDNIISYVFGFLSLLLMFTIIEEQFKVFPFPAERQSDVLSQLQAQYQAFTLGKLPYFPLAKFPWHPYPVYMPLHWLPIGMGDWLDIDPRMGGIIILGFVGGIAGMLILQRKQSLIDRLLAFSLPAIALWLSFTFGKIDYAATFETVIAAYYLLLAIGLAQRNLVMVTIGIICCVLSRYTMLFWLPMFLVLLMSAAPMKKNVAVWLSIVLSVLLIYILPFYLRDPSIFAKGIAYHNKAVIGEWQDPAYTLQYGINFSGIMKTILGGDLAHKVLVTRILQGTMLLALFFSSLVLYRRWKSKINFYDYSLAMLYLFVLVFYMFSPLTYRYYYLPLLMISAVICGRIILTANKPKQETA